jgi:hypothetical protein
MTQERDEKTRELVEFTFNEFGEMAEIMAVELEARGDKHGASVMRTFKRTMLESMREVLSDRKRVLQ